MQRPEAAGQSTRSNRRVFGDCGCYGSLHCMTCSGFGRRPRLMRARPTGASGAAEQRRRWNANEAQRRATLRTLTLCRRYLPYRPLHLSCCVCFADELLSVVCPAHLQYRLHVAHLLRCTCLRGTADTAPEPGWSSPCGVYALPHKASQSDVGL